MDIYLKIENPVHVGYVNYLFERTDDGSFIVTRKSMLGKLMTSLVSRSDTPVADGRTEEKVFHFILPNCNALRGFNKGFLYYNASAIAKLMDAISALADIDFDRFYITGRKLGYKQNDIIWSYMNSRGITDLGIAPDRFKKRTYRADLGNMKEMHSKLLESAKYSDRRIRNELKTTIKI